MALVMNVSAALILLMMVLIQVDSQCCKPSLLTNDSDNEKICQDGTKGTPCCGITKCDSSCCNCAGGCRKSAVDRWPDYANGEGGVKWQLDCDFPGHDISNQAAEGEDCGRICYKNPNCNTFSYHNGICYLKNVPQWSDPSRLYGGMCGFLPWSV